MTTTPTPTAGTDTADLLTAALADATRERDQGDHKANSNLSGLIAILGAEVAALIAASKQLGTPGIAVLLVSVTALVAAGAYFGAAIRPARPGSSRWGFVHAARTPPDVLVDEHRHLASNPGEREQLLATALHHQAARVAQKYQLIRNGQMLAAVGVLLGITAGVVAALT